MWKKINLTFLFFVTIVALFGTATVCWHQIFAKRTNPLAANTALPESRVGTETVEQKEAIFAKTIVIHEKDKYLIPIVTPVAAKLSDSSGPTLLVAYSDATSSEVSDLIRNSRSTDVLVIRSENTTVPLQGERCNVGVAKYAVSVDGFSAAVEIARKFWGHCDRVVLADKDEPQAVLVASALSAHLRIAFLPIGRNVKEGFLADSLKTLGAKNILIVATSKVDPPTWAKIPNFTTNILSVCDVQDKLVRTLGPTAVRNIIVTRSPNSRGSNFLSSWMAPYLSFARKSAIILVDTSDAIKVEATFDTFVSTHKLCPKTVTILGSYKSIGVLSITDQNKLGNYKVEIEPCSGTIGVRAAAYGVGRIPFTDTSRASLLIANGLTKERIDSSAATRVLMVANPSTEYGELPLAETVARLTAEEFRNLHVPIEAFYGTRSNGREILQIVNDASLIIYQGHIVDLLIFDSLAPTGTIEDKDADDMPYAIFIWENMWDSVIDRLVLIRDIPYILWYNKEEINDWQKDGLGIIEPDDIAKRNKFINGQPDDFNSRIMGDTIGKTGDSTASHRSPESLKCFPLVILQSCESLQDVSAATALKNGASGVVGSVTSIHSASGSSFVKAFCDGALYRGETAGEALRDARNYFLLLGELKEMRGHKQQAKVYRAALSFRLWGDPELRVLPAIQCKPTYRPIVARFLSRNKILISTPRKKLPEIRTASYLMKAFPGSQTAGIVKRLKNRPQRRLMANYFFRLDSPESFCANEFTLLRRSGDNDTRAVFSIDPHNRYVYVLYFPAKEKKQQKIKLRFGK